MNETRIETADLTWNPKSGCLGPEGSGRLCGYCYAADIARRRLRHLYLANPNVLAGHSADPFAPRWWPHRLTEPYHLRKPAKIFVVDMGDLFGPWVPRLHINAVQTVVRECPRHTFQFLTKWPERLLEFNPWPENAWVGATATSSAELCRAVTGLTRTDASVVYASIEPLLSHIEGPLIQGLDWVIVGAQTGPGAVAPQPEWVSELLTYGQHYGIPVFLKNSLRWPEIIRQWPDSHESGKG